MSLFYTPYLLEDQPVLNDVETHHCVKVLRKNKGDVLFLTDGKGNMFKAVILEVQKKNTFLKIVEKYPEYNKRNYKLHVAIAPTKNIDRFEWFLEKATEIGIDEITPIITKNSERKIIKPERLNKVIEAAIKQSYKAYCPKLNEIINLDKFVQSKSYSKQYIAHCNDDENKKYLANLVNPNDDSLIIIGPEGDFNEIEIEMCKNNDFIPVSISNSRLRTETAGVHVCSLIACLNET